MRVKRLGQNTFGEDIFECPVHKSIVTLNHFKHFHKELLAENTPKEDYIDL